MAYATLVHRLYSSHEEAHTRMLLHAKDASEAGWRNVVIKSPDTDVAVLAIGLAHQIQAHRFFLTGESLPKVLLCSLCATLRSQ